MNQNEPLPHDIYELIGSPPTPWWWWPAIVVIVILLVASIWLVWRKFFAKKKSSEVTMGAAPSVTVREISLAEELRRIIWTSEFDRSQQIITAHAFSHWLRRFIEQNLSINATDMTTAEVERALRHKNWPWKNFGVVSIVENLQELDRVRFADAPWAAAEAEMTKQQAEALLHELR